MFLTYLMLVVALCLSAIAAFYSIVGLTAIFAAAVIPIIVMGSILEIAKLTVTVWLHEYWRQCRLAMKAYLVPAVFILMVITSMGIFGFLSKAHLDQAVPTGDVAAQVSLLDEKIRTQRDNIDAARRALAQMDAAVDQILGRSNDEQGAQRAANLRRQQGAERNRLNADIGRAQTEIAKLNEQRAPIAATLRKVEAEVGPVKYIAALIYGDNPDANLLEKAVRWVIIILVVVFDPLAIFMLLAATESYKWERERRQGIAVTESPDQPVHDSVKKMRDRAINLWSRWRNQNATDDVMPTPAKDMDGQSPRDDLEHQPVVEVVEQPPVAEQPKITYEIVEDADDEDFPESRPSFTIEQLKKKQKTLPEGLGDEWQNGIPDQSNSVNFGTTWPRYAVKGDLFVKLNQLPTSLYKFNGEEWIEANKNLTDSYVYSTQYIDFLIRKIGSGEYDPELLTDAEREQIELRLRENI
jgi:hypothetical protein